MRPDTFHTISSHRLYFPLQDTPTMSLSLFDRLSDITQEDTTPSNITNRDSIGLLSAYFGLDDAFPNNMEALCPNSTGKDGMPVVFSHELDPSTMQAGDFLITNSDGDKVVPLCATFRPASDEGELRTVLLTGQFGTQVLESVCIVGDIWDKCHRRTFRDSCIRPKPAGVSVPELVLAEVLNVTATATACPAEASKAAIRATWDAGVTLVNRDPVTADYASKYSITLADGSVVHPVTLADIDDVNTDNNHLLCFDSTNISDFNNAAMSLAFEGGFLTDPGENGFNPETAVNITMSVTCQKELEIEKNPNETDGVFPEEIDIKEIGTTSGVPIPYMGPSSFSWLWLTGLTLLRMFRI